MALGDLMSSQFSQWSLAVSNHVIDGNLSSGGCHDDDVAYADLMSQRRDLDAASTSSYANGVTSTATVPTTMAYLPQTVVLCELQHAAFEASTPAGPSDSGLVSKWRPKYRGYPAVRPELDLVEEDDQLTHEISLQDEIDPKITIDIFKPDPQYLENEN